MVTNSLQSDIMVDDLASYLARNNNLVFPHRQNFYHFVLFTNGSGTHTIDFETFDIEPWQIYFMSPGQIHSWDFKKDMQGFVVNFHQDFFKNLLMRSDYLDNFPFFSGLVRDEVFGIEQNIQQKVSDLLTDIKNNITKLEFVRVSLLYLFHLLELQREPIVSQEINAYNHTLLRNFINLIELNYKSLRLPKDYAALLYITPNHLNALCKERLGQSAGELIRNRIILEAKRLLVIKDYSVSEIAYTLSFNDNSYFTKFFKKIEGMTPEEFRKKQALK